MGQLAHAYPHFRDAGVALLMVSVDSVRRARQLAEQTNPPFPVLSDADADATVAFDIFENGIALPSAWVIDREGTVQWAYIGEHASDRPTPEVMLDQARSLTGADKQ
jgi:peroxiredoxin